MNGTAVTTPPASALELTEAVASPVSPLREDGTVDIVIIRPGIGMGRGRHYYGADMLQENADKFSGWNVYIDHLSPVAKKAAGGLPRSMKDLGGMIEESWWDHSIPSTGRFEQGAVMGRLRPIRELKEVVQELPQAARFSIKAKATGVHQDLMEGAPAWVVEGISENSGSVDAVTEDGAGGQIANLIESLDGAEVLQEAVDLGLVTGSKTFQTETGQYDMASPEAAVYSLAEARIVGIDEYEAVLGHVSERYPELTKPPSGTDERDQVGQLEEALRDPESEVGREVREIARAEATSLVEAAREEGRQAGLEEARSETAAETLKRDMRDEAHRLIEEAKLPSDAATEKLQRKFSLEESALDFTDEVDEDGTVTKDAMTQLREAVETEITETRAILAEANPTRVSGQGAGSAEAGTRPAATSETSYHAEVLEEAGFEDVESLYATTVES